MELKVIPAFEVASIWPKVADFIGSAMAYDGDGVALDDVFEALEYGSMQLFTVGPVSDPKAAAVVSIRHDLSRARIHWCGGTGIDEWIDCVQGIKTWAANQGLKKTRTTCREGFVKKLHGWRKLGIVLETINE